MQLIELSTIDRVLVGGAWIEIEPGSLEEMTGHIAPGGDGGPQPLMVFTFRGTSERGVVRTQELVGWAPYGAAEAPPPIAHPEVGAGAAPDPLIFHPTMRAGTSSPAAELGTPVHRP